MPRFVLCSPDTKFECKPYNTYRFYQEERIRYIRYLIFLNFCAIGCGIEHLQLKLVNFHLEFNAHVDELR